MQAVFLKIVIKCRCFENLCDFSGYFTQGETVFRFRELPKMRYIYIFCALLFSQD